MNFYVYSDCIYSDCVYSDCVYSDCIYSDCVYSDFGKNKMSKFNGVSEDYPRS